MNIAPEGIEPPPPDYEPGTLPLSHGAFCMEWDSNPRSERTGS